MKAQTRGFSRREFLCSLAAVTAAASWSRIVSAAEAPLKDCPIVVFSKIYQELKLGFEEAASLTEEAGLKGIDCPVRPGGEIAPEHAIERLPEYADILRRRGLGIHLLTTSITSPRTAHAERVLRAAAKLGVRHYRLGAFKKDKSSSVEKQVAEIQSGLKDLAGLNRELGMTALFQNHQGSFGADLGEMARLLDGLEVARIGAAFDLGHALVVHGSEWKRHFEIVREHLRVAYVKDARIGGTWTAFGEGDMARTGYFGILKRMNYSAPFTVHIEYDWAAEGGKNRLSLLKALTHSRKTLQSWLEQA